MQATLPSAEAASGTQQTDPSPKPAGGGGGTKQDKERLRRLPTCVHSTHTNGVLMMRACVGVWWSSESTARSMNEALAQAEKHASRSEPLAALMAEAKAAHEQARAAAAE